MAVENQVHLSLHRNWVGPYLNVAVASTAARRPVWANAQVPVRRSSPRSELRVLVAGAALRCVEYLGEQYGDDIDEGEALRVVDDLFDQLWDKAGAGSSSRLLS